MSNLIVSASPHIRSKDTTQRIMRDVVIALVPALIASVVLFGMRALLVTAVCVVTCVVSEYVFEMAVKRPSTISDLSAVVTGMLLAFNLPVGIPLWMAVVGSLAAIVVVKQLFGGIGHNFANPAITARVIMLISFAQPMTQWVLPQRGTDGIELVSGATPLAHLSSGNLAALPSLTDMFLGIRGGCLGETCALALILGGAYLLWRRVITFHIPLAFIGTVFVLTALLGKQPMYQVLGGGLLIGAFFMATDYSTSPASKTGKIVFGIGCGLITVLIRVYGSYPEGVSFAILLMNIVTPHISKLTVPKPFGAAASKS
ncbi:MAG TPA: RnfABCDGE type electron transport complex subunit D [Candidatus Fimivivens faecavium]|nr:RnfABCDGE type electron transport complex subunit D [Candidatus Fimivivens faecavium]